MYCLPCAPVDHQLLGVSYTLAFRAVSFLYFDARFKLCHPFIHVYHILYDNKNKVDISSIFENSTSDFTLKFEHM